MRNKLPVAAIALAALMTGCNNTTVSNRIELPGTVDSEAFAANIESISVMNLQMDDDLALTDLPFMTVTDNYIYLLDNPLHMGNSRLRLMCFDKQTGDKLAARSIEGRGPGEIASTLMINIFGIGDSLGIHSMSNTILCDHNCMGVSNLDIFDGFIDKVFRLRNGKYALYSLMGFGDHYMEIIDDSLNVVSQHFNAISGNSSQPEFCVNNDTLRFVYSAVNQLFTFYDGTEHCTELAVPNPMTPELFMKAVLEHKSLTDLRKEYDGLFSGLQESGRFLTLQYSVENQFYTALIDKRTNKAISYLRSNNEGEFKTSDILFRLMAGSIYSDGKYIYNQLRNELVANLLEGHDDLLDTRLKKAQAEYRAYLERNAEYIKSLEPEERDAANVILKIKLKD